MHVTLKRYRIMMFTLGGIIATLLILIVLALKTDMFKIYKPAPEVDTQKAIPETFEAPPSPFLEEEEVVIIESITKEETKVILPIEKVLFEYVEVIDGCTEHFEGDCLNVRSGPGTEYPVTAQLRNGVVLKVGGKVEHAGQAWYKIIFDEWLRYPNRVKGDWYVSAEFVKIVLDEGDRTVWDHGKATSTKEIIIYRSEQTLYAYDQGKFFMGISISTGLELTPTPKGTFTIFKKTPSRYMQGPIPNIAEQYYDMPGVPWNLYFTHGGAVVHGAYWHNSFGTAYSHGCVNLPPDEARKLYNWAELGTKVIVRD